MLAKTDHLKSLFIVIFASSLIILSGCSKKMKNSDAALKKSVTAALNDGNWKNSLKYAEMSVKISPDNIDAQIMKAIALARTNNKTEASALLKSIIDKNPDNFLAQISLGELLYSMKNYEGAYDYLVNAYNLRPDNVDALVMLCECSSQLQTQTTPDLYLKLSQSEQYKNRPEVYNNLAVYYANAGKPAFTVKYLEKAISIDPSNPMINLNTGKIYDYYLEQPKKARLYYRKFISVGAGNSLYSKQIKEVSSRLKEM